MRRLAARAARAAPDVAAPAQPDIRAVDPLPRATAASTAHSTGVEKSAPTATYALTTWTLRTAAESEQVQAAMRTLLALTADKAAPVQRVPVGDDWRVMAGPFVSAAVAEKARALLLARGVKTEVVHVPAASSWAGAAVPVAR